MNIYSEYRFQSENAVLPDSALKVLGLHADGFYYLSYNNEQLFYALSVGAKRGFGFEEAVGFVAQHAGIQFLPLSHVYIQPEASVPVDGGLLQSNSARALFEYCYPLEPNFELIENPVADIVLLSSCRNQILEEIRQNRLPIYDFTVSWLHKIFELAISDCVHVHVLPSSFLIAIFSSGKMQLFNSFKFEAKSDFLYFLLGSVNASGNKPETMSLRLSGEIAPSSLLAEAVLPYFASVEYNAAGFNASEDSRILSMQLYPLFARLL